MILLSSQSTIDQQTRTTLPDRARRQPGRMTSDAYVAYEAPERYKASTDYKQHMLRQGLSHRAYNSRPKVNYGQ